MGLTYEIDRDRGVVLTTATGVINDTDLLEHKRRLLADPAFRPDMRELSDVRRVERLDVTPAGIAAAVGADRASPAFRNHRLALLASADVVYGMARMYSALTEENTAGVRVFRDEAEARRWLGLEPDG